MVRQQTEFSFPCIMLETMLYTKQPTYMIGVETFISFPMSPHLLKTLRNNFSNSYSHNTSRRVWINGESVAIGLEECYGRDVEETVKFIRHVNMFF